MMLISTGNTGLDYVLRGGLPAARMYLLEGDPGTGKTSLSLKFLMDGANKGEVCLHISLAESHEELLDVAESHGWDLSQVKIQELLPCENLLEPEAHYTVFHPSEVELGDSLGRMFELVRELCPDRIVVDSLSEIRLLAEDPLRYRRQLLHMKMFFLEQQATVLLLDDRTSPGHDLQLHSLVHGVISLEQLIPDYGSERRRMKISKMRGRSYLGGYHDFRILQGGVEVYPRARSFRHKLEYESSILPSGLKEFDSLLGGGLHRGTNTLLLGPAGVGKSSVALQYAIAAVDRGESAAVFLFDEQKNTLLRRFRSTDHPLEPRIESGRLHIFEFLPATVTPGEIAHQLFELVEEQNVSVFVLDGVNGYLNAMPGQEHLLTQLHELLSVLSNAGVTSLMIVAQHGVLGSSLSSPVDASYLADSLLLFRFFEIDGEVRRAISVVKKRSGNHERTIRELGVHEGGVEIGPPLEGFQGVLSGQPSFRGARKPLL